MVGCPRSKQSTKHKAREKVGLSSQANVGFGCDPWSKRCSQTSRFPLDTSPQPGAASVDWSSSETSCWFLGQSPTGKVLSFPAEFTNRRIACRQPVVKTASLTQLAARFLRSSSPFARETGICFIINFTVFLVKQFIRRCSLKRYINAS